MMAPPPLQTVGGKTLISFFKLINYKLQKNNKCNLDFVLFQIIRIMFLEKIYLFITIICKDRSKSIRLTWDKNNKSTIIKSELLYSLQFLEIILEE